MNLINTPSKLSELTARDAIYIDKMEQDVGKAECHFKGQLDGACLGSEAEFLDFSLSFFSVLHYDCTLLDYSTLDHLMTSNFKIWEDSVYLRKRILPNHNHYVFST